MKNIVLIGRFDDIAKDLTSVLSKHFSVQECFSNPELLKGFLTVAKPAAAIVSLVGVNKEYGRILGVFKNNGPKIPVFCIGTEAEQSMFTGYFRDNRFFPLTRPVSSTVILDAVCTKTGDSTKGSIFGETTPFFGKKKILLVDDNAIVLRTLNGFLTPAYEVYMATSGSKALKLIERNRPDMIFLDYEMPECNGFETLRLIRAMDGGGSIPVVFLTGVKDKDHIMALLALKPEGYLLKPASKDKIIETIERVLGGNT